MAWDSKSSRRRQSNAATKSTSTQPMKSSPTLIFEPKSTHVADPALQPFLNPAFDAAEYLNMALPSLQPQTTNATNSQSAAAKGSVPLAELSTQTQALLSQLSAHTTRLTSTLTQLTDEILRSGSRLAYEVEVLRGDTHNLSEALTESLQEDVASFVPGGLDAAQERKQSTLGEGNEQTGPSSRGVSAKLPIAEADKAIVDPPYITKLRTLTLVRSRLDTVIKTFGDAMAWTFPPSEVSVSSSFLSVSAPEPGSAMHSTEEKGHQVSKKLRDEIADLLIGGDPVDGIEAAAKRVEELKELAIVWKGTAEERARVKFVESLAKLVEDRHKELLRDSEQASRLNQKVEKLSQEAKAGGNTEDAKSQGGYGFLSHLQKLRGAT
ncbi:Uncharacterized protein BP5553_01244 [Venustampulla echinocandica]|uniref:Uncharacterized protein n=1 Tax=Venustampulla echinocandica TaxID=2656787 RepID=A0A370U0G9_9HELO|nr:Uncharacterized protein BP5553_01244 [Venustampulla echinocandica]RDL41265.1 Uncharacterized protein BP5553_01244 [Venustampulla echinocandica]